MSRADPLVRTKLHLPFTRSGLVPRPRLQEQVAQGLCGPLTLITAPAGFGKTTLVASCVASCGMPVAWLSLDKNDNETGRFLSYLVAALQEADRTIGSEAAQLLAGVQQGSPEAALTTLINDLDASGKDTVLVLEDCQFIESQAVHAAIAFLLEHCPRTLHVVIATRSDPPLPLARLRGRGQTVELRGADLRFTEREAAQFLNDVMGLRLDAESVAALEERTEGWIAGLQMAALSMRDRENVAGFIESFSGTNRYILDYLLDEVLANQQAEFQDFLLHTSILERLTAPLCDAVLANDGAPLTSSVSILEYLDRANLFLVPLDDERTWYRYHYLFADLLRTQLQKSLGAPGVAQLHVRAAEWHAQNGSMLEAINHASAAADDERVERFIEQHYRELVSRGEMTAMRYWTGKLTKDLVYRRPWLCIYEAHSHAWFGELDEADRLLEAAEKRIRSEMTCAEVTDPDARWMLAHRAYVKSRVTAMRGDIARAIQFSLMAREYAPANNLSLQFNTRVTLGYEYFLNGDYDNASRVLNDAIHFGISAGALIYTVAAACMAARMFAVQGQLHQSYDTYQMAAHLIAAASGEHRDATALVEVGLADVLCEWNDLDGALGHLQLGLALLPLWGKADDFILAYVTLARIHLARANTGEAGEAVKQAARLLRTRGVFSEARNAVEIGRVKLWLARGDLGAASHWAASTAQRLASNDPFGFHGELARLAGARVLIAQNKAAEATVLLSHLEETAQAQGRMGRVIEILLLKARALQRMRDSEQAIRTMTRCLALAQPEGYARVFLDEGQPMRMLLAQWLGHASAGPLREYAIRLLSEFDTEASIVHIVPAEASPAGNPVKPEVPPAEAVLVEPLSERELEVLHLMALGRTNQDIAEQLIIAPGTVKAHAASIYRKLEVANRTEAVACARELGIIP